jgi:tetratricopeptide (TPR) repeat protein
MNRTLSTFSCLCLLTLQPISTVFAEQESSLSAQESFQLKRISEYWKDKNFEAAKKQILDYLSNYPKSSANEHLYAMLGDLYFHENNFEEALCAYEQVENKALEEKIIFNQIECLFELKDYPSVADLAHTYFEKGRNEREEGSQIHFMAAESLFKLGLKAEGKNQKELFAQAKAHYDALLNTPYEEFSLFPLAEIHKNLKETDKAIACYLILAQKYPEKQEECLFQAAILQTPLQVDEAIATFAKVVACGGKRAPLAAFNELSLLFQNKRYALLIDTHEKVSKLISEKHAAPVQYYLGKSYFLLGEYQKAVAPLSTFIQSKDVTKPQLKTALLNLILCAKELKNPKLFDQHAQSLFAQFGDVEQKEAILYDYALLLSTTEQWHEARIASLHFLRGFPRADKNGAMLRHLIFCSQQDLKCCGGEKQAEKRIYWIADLSLALECVDQISDQERATYRNLLIKAYHDNDQYEAALRQIEKALQTSPDDVQLHLWAAACEQKLHCSEGFVTHAEKVLSLNPNAPEKDTLHIELYNTYLELSYFDQAAKHLMEYTFSNAENIHEHNLRWLANFTYEKVVNGDRSYLQKAQQIFGKLVKQPLQITDKNLYLEKEILKWAELFGVEKREKERSGLLALLVAEYEKQPTLAWRYQRRATFELAKSYEALADRPNALKAYDSLASSSNHVTSFIGCAALLQKSRIKYALLEDSKKNENNPEVEQILNDLKDLQIRKKLSLEPLHLEAGLDYIDIKNAITDESARDAQQIFLLKRFEEDFTKGYSEEYLNESDNKELFETYLQYARAQMLMLEAKTALKNHEIEQAKELKEEAIEELNDLLSKKDALTPYLLERIENTRKAI